MFRQAWLLGSPEFPTPPSGIWQQASEQDQQHIALCLDGVQEYCTASAPPAGLEAALPLLTKERGDRGLRARLLPPARLPFPLLIDSSALGLVTACRLVMATPRAEARGLFRKGVEAVLGSWPALQLPLDVFLSHDVGFLENWKMFVAVENGFGGAYSQEKAEWMVEAVEQYFQSNADLELDEIEDFLAELMNNEFDTMIEDGSLAQVSQQLRLFFGQCQQGEGAAVHEAIVRLAQKKQEAKVAAAKSKPAEESSSEEEQGTEEEAMDCSAAPSMNGAQPSPPPSSGADPEDGWTLVRKKKK
uniref:pre-rRNA-processing protein TSR2 homolog isoform X1 n=1 Tax=Podarcis muralis TaxID=64176 RepID=UPI0010A0AC53|nr:pre-rRNA-processing protein TSR2 homolog isoform X1 [Podarcis muralis]